MTKATYTLILQVWRGFIELILYLELVPLLLDHESHFGLSSRVGYREPENCRFDTTTKRKVPTRDRSNKFISLVTKVDLSFLSVSSVHFTLRSEFWLNVRKKTHLQKSREIQIRAMKKIVGCFVIKQDKEIQWPFTFRSKAISLRAHCPGLKCRA